jgi:glycosyltransferase involved in cell wall biosynthesis
VSKISKLAFITNAQKSGNKGGAEIFNERMVEHFKLYVPLVDHIEVPCSEDTFEDILKGYVICYDLDLSKYDGVVSAKAPTFAAQHKNHVCYLQHTVRVFYDMFDEIKDHPGVENQQRLIHRMDSELLSPSRIKKLFSIGYEVNRRLELYNGLTSTVMHHGIPAGDFYCKEFDYIYMPGRLHRWKRVDLVIDAMRYVKSPVKLKVAGAGEDLPKFKELADVDKRIEFLGYIPDDMLKEYYANSLCVMFTPIREDYGMILHEGFKSRKPVITCTDSGEPVVFIKENENGFVVEPDPKKIAKKIDYLYKNKDKAAEMGINGYESIAHITWDNVVKTLLEALEE